MLHDTTTKAPIAQDHTPTQTIRLLCQGDTEPFSSPQFIFEHMVRLAQPLMESYQSDLWHDAMWLAKHASQVMPGQAVHFHWYVSPSHTHLGNEALMNPYKAHRHYHFTLSLDAHSGWWTLVIDRED
jgi:hypothetical protein